jgi:hypothetical protein
MGPRLVLAVLVALALGACAARPTPYQPRTDGGGYTEQQIDASTWRVTFAGNFDTSRETVDNYLLYRSAEIMRFGGFEKFVVLEKEIESTVEYTQYERYPYDYGHGYYDRHGRYRYYPYPRYYGPTRSIPFVRYTGYATIRTYTEGPPPGGGPVYDANQLIRQLGPSIRIPGQPAG